MNSRIRPRILRPVDLAAIEEVFKEACQKLEADYDNVDENEQEERRHALREQLYAAYRPDENERATLIARALNETQEWIHAQGTRKASRY